ncbi:MAG TPA: RNA polymerase sigma factor [Candidatus Eisenbacteria bacterium]|nr:RNA polymerase sigma factor [Candidatus Eisenbacteria bacterium]
MTERGTSEPPDAALVVAARAGDEAAFARLMMRHHAGCLRFARHQLGDPVEAEDIVQDTFIRAYRALGRYHERDGFRSWLFRILVNRCRSFARRRQRRRERFVRDDAALERATTADGAANAAIARRLEHALDGLKAEYREAFLLRVGEELDYAEMARITGASEAALRMRVKRARDHVRARWGSDGRV